VDRSIGLDAHASSCTLAVVSGSGKRIGTQVVETNARCLIDAVRQIPKPRYICRPGYLIAASDKGSGYVSHAFAKAMAGVGARHLPTRSYAPRTNGKAERFIQSALRERGSCSSIQVIGSPLAALNAWVQYYNRVGPGGMRKLGLLQ
jgi:transposase InsO family protein